MDEPTCTSAGLAFTASITGHRLIVPTTETEPVFGDWRQVMWMTTEAVACAFTSNVAAPLHVVPASREVALSVSL